MYGCNVSVLLNTQLVSLSYLFDLLCPVAGLVRGLISSRSLARETFTPFRLLPLSLAVFLSILH